MARGSHERTNERTNERRVVAVVVAARGSRAVEHAFRVARRGGPLPIRCDDLTDALHVIRWRSTGAVFIEELRHATASTDAARQLAELSRCITVVCGTHLEGWMERNWPFIGPPAREPELGEPQPGWSGGVFTLGALHVRRDRGCAWFRGQRREPTPALWRVLLVLCDAWPGRVDVDRDDVCELRALFSHGLIATDYSAGYRLVALGARPRPGRSGRSGARRRRGD